MNFFKLLILTFVMVSLNACMDKPEETLESATDIKGLSSKEQITWDLGDLYLDIESWNRSRSQISSKFQEIKDCEGKLGESSEFLSICLDLINDTYKDLLFSREIFIISNIICKIWRGYKFLESRDLINRKNKTKRVYSQ